MEKVKLGDIAVLINGDRGKNYPSQADITEEGDVPFVNAGHLTGRTIDFGDMNYISKEKYEKLSSGKFEKGDILYCLRGSLGKKAIVNDDVAGAIASSLVIIRPDYEKIDGDYLMFSLDSPSIKEQLVKANNGSSQPNLSAASVREYQIELPDISLQKEVVEKLTRVRNVIDERQKELNLLDELIKARFVEMFGEGLKDDGKFEVRLISEIGKVVSGATPKTAVEEYWDGANLWITPAELTDESFILYDSERKITDRGVKSCAVNLLPIGTVILSSRAPIGKVAIAGTDMYCNQGFKNIIPNDMINSIYLYELLKMETAYLNSLGRGATFKEISKQIVENIRIKVPPIELQEQFAEFVKQVDKSKVVKLTT